jgi:hypothetical protein
MVVLNDTDWIVRERVPMYVLNNVHGGDVLYEIVLRVCIFVGITISMSKH